MIVSLSLGACASSPEYPIDTAPPREGDKVRPENGAREDGRGRESASTERMRQSTEDNNDWGDAFTAPLEDFNLKRQDIPEILQNAVIKPYDLAGLDNCEAIASQVAQLDALLGRDFDEPPPPKDERTNSEKGKAFANKQAVGAVRGATRGIVPFRGAIRYLSGADKHQKQLDNAIQAGKVRRAYLKGVGMNKNCAPPAAPSWFKPRVYVETYVQPPKPVADVPVKKTTSKKRTSKKRR
ncbi:hypothetical protein ABI_37520 [Asticcacaulis biprosthecium C19]|uniref:Uncharacterized protein n=1 Tax=Asticcacaulis biprosthecium C19 TaxID=715226 RepID=F4QR83_9CAUL|nr:hypothetical protein [Asticcacaulis biprosthecium]EGF90720.1 hypothetical protein ABI_37520 [Asticcacaulis biprosthecium C19]